MKKTIFITLVALMQLVNVHQIYSQSGLKIMGDMQAPSTDAWNFIKYGEVGTNLYTGTLNVSIPFYTYKDNDFEIPISFDYASNGLLANTRAGILGPDWVLNAGGCISVDIKGMPDNNYDEKDRMIYGFYNLHKSGNIRDINKLWRFYDFISQDVWASTPFPEIIYCSGDGEITSSGIKYDAEPDIYHFNMMGHSGTFHLGLNNKIYVYNTNGNKGYKIQIPNGPGFDFREIMILSPDGYNYLFKLYPLNGINADMVNVPTLSNPKILSWKLSEIVAPNGRIAKFNYEQYEITHIKPNTFCDYGQYYNVFKINQDMEWHKRPIDAGEIALYESVVKTAYLSSIEIDGVKRVEFTYENMPVGSRDTYKKDSSPKEFTICPRLKKIEVVDGTNKIKNCVFGYTFNIGSNYLSSVNISGEGVYAMNYYYGGIDCVIGTHSLDHWGYYNGRGGDPFLKIAISNPTTCTETFISNNRNQDSTCAKYGMLEKLIYPTGGYTLFEYGAHDYSKAIKRTYEYGFFPEMVNEFGNCGGLRIKNIKNYTKNDNGNYVLSDSKEYSYKDGGSSSGILLHMPRYHLEYSASTPYALPAFRVIEQNVEYWSSGLLSYNNTHIEYQNVTEKRQDGSKVVYSFSNSSIDEDYKDDIDLLETVPERTPAAGMWVIQSPSQIHTIVSPVASRQGERGKLIKKDIYNSEKSTPIYSEEYVYNNKFTKPLECDYVPAYIIRSFAYTKVFVDNYDLIGKKIKRDFENVSTLENTLFTYNAYGQVSTTTMTNSKGGLDIIKYEYANDYLNLGGVYSTMISRNLLNYPVTIKNFYKPSGGNEVQTGGQRYTYALFGTLIKPSTIESYNTTTGTWQLETTFDSYDAKGNLTQSTDNNGVPTSYIWGYNGLYLVAKGQNVTYSRLSNNIGISSVLAGAVTASHATVTANCPNALIDFYEYQPLVGLSKHTDFSGKVLTYSHNSSGKLKAITDENGKLHNEYLYSPDNKQ